MTNPLNSETAKALGFLFPRVALGYLMAMAGFNKLTAKTGLKEFVNDHIAQVPVWFGKEMGRAYLYSLPFLETLVGLLLIVGLFTRWAAFVNVLLLGSFIFAMGSYLSPIVKGGPHPNLIYLSVAILIWLNGPGKISVDQKVFSKGGGGGGAPKK